MSAPVITAGVPRRDDCPILTRLKAFVVDQGVAAILEHTFRDRDGRVLDISNLVGASPQSASISDSVSASDTPTCSVKVRIKEFLGTGYDDISNPVWTLDGSTVNAETGKVRAQLTWPVVERAGIYEMSWAIYDHNNGPVLVNRGLLSVERSLWAIDPLLSRNDIGPPTLQEVRMRIRDSAGADNVLLDAIEFSDEEVMLAMTEPVRKWNEEPPPIRRFTTRDFPFRGAWITGVMAQLHYTAAAFYRRNRLAHAAGGTAIDDLNKEREYMAEADRLWTNEYVPWLRRKKVEINLKLFMGESRSAYSFRNGGW